MSDPCDLLCHRLRGDDVNDEDLAFAEDFVARFLGRSVRQLRAWSDLVPPSTVRRLSQRNQVRLYGFDDVLALRVVSELQTRRVHIRVIRRAVQALRDEYERPLTQLTWAEHAGEVYFQHPDGSWTGGIQPRQIVFWTTLALEPLRQSIRESVGRSRVDFGRVERHRGRLGSKELFAGTRIPVRAVARQLSEGVTAEELLDSYPALTRDDIELARLRVG